MHVNVLENVVAEELRLVKMLLHNYIFAGKGLNVLLWYYDF